MAILRFGMKGNVSALRTPFAVVPFNPGSRS